MIIGPVYYSSTILGSLHHPVHFRRAVYGRIEPLSEGELPAGFRVNNAYRLMTSTDEPRRVRKSPSHAVTWCISWPNYEVLVAAKGRCKIGNASPQICKRVAFARFQHIYQMTHKNLALPPALTYSEAKAMATAFQNVKQMFNQVMESQGYGKWISKPVEIDSFVLA